MKLDEILSATFGTISASTCVMNFSDMIDIVWKIVGIISGVIAITCFVKGAVNRIKIKFKDAKADGVITSDEAKDIATEALNDGLKVLDMAKSIYDKSKINETNNKEE